MRQSENWPPGHHGTEQREWCDDKADDRNGKCIGQWGNQRKLLKNQQQYRQ